MRPIQALRGLRFSMALGSVVLGAFLIVDGIAEWSIGAAKIAAGLMFVAGAAVVYQVEVE